MPLGPNLGEILVQEQAAAAGVAAHEGVANRDLLVSARIVRILESGDGFNCADGCT